jgi:hypothetical protein
VMGRGWGGDEKGEVSSRATWDQGGQGHITPKEGFQVSKGNKRGSQRIIARGAKGENCATNCVVSCICVYNNCLNVRM